MFSLLLKRGRLLDPGRGLDRIGDIAFAHARIGALDDAIPESAAERTVDVEERIVAPGLIDLHTHIYWGVTELGVEVDSTCLARGVTTALDTGSAGWVTFPGFREYVIKRARTRVFALLNIAPAGTLVFYPKLLYGNLEFADVVDAIRVAQANREYIKGIKVLLSGHYVGARGLQPLWIARFAADKAELPLMVHIGNTPVPLPEVLAVLRSGDIITHCCNGLANGILGHDGTLLPAVREATERGVIFDVGHGSGSFKFAVARAAIEQGLRPTISTDLQSLSVYGPVFDLPTTMSKFLTLGLSLPEVVRLTTAEPARVLGQAEDLGTLRPGAAGDAVVLECRDGRFEFRDSHDNVLVGHTKIEPWMVVRNGSVVTESSYNSLG